MSYSTNNEVIARMGSDVLGSLHGGTLDEAKVKASRVLAGGTVDSYLAGREHVPVNTFADSGLAGRLRDVELSIVAWHEHSRQDTVEISERVQARYEAALQWLQDVRDMRLPLRPALSNRVGSVAVVRGDYNGERPNRTLQFNQVSEGASSLRDMEWWDAGHSYWVADGPGYIYAAMVEVYGVIGQALLVQPIINGAAWDGLTDLDLAVGDVTTLQSIGGDNVSVTEAVRADRNVANSSAYAFVKGDRIGLRMIPDGELTAGVDIRGWLTLFYTGGIDVG